MDSPPIARSDANAMTGRQQRHTPNWKSLDQHAPVFAAGLALIASVSLLLGCSQENGPEKPATNLAHNDSSTPISGESPSYKSDSATDSNVPSLPAPSSSNQASYEPASSAKQALPVYRRDETVRNYDDELLARAGIFKYESKRLQLYTDIDPRTAESLPPLVDQLFDALAKYLGELPPSRSGKAYRMIGYIMSDRALFQQAGLLPEELPQFEHGRHRVNEFWMNAQKHDYYLRHLMLHEATHCYMTAQENTVAPVWYFEGTAEVFGTHTIDDNGQAQFRVMPYDRDAFPGLGRISLVQADRDENGLRTAAEVASLTAEDFFVNESYAWSWALCQFLDSHPRYQKPFRTLGNALTEDRFFTVFKESFSGHIGDLRTEWALFASHIQHGYDIPRAAIDFQAGSRVDASIPAECAIRADRGWQSTAALLESGVTYEITASGQYSMAQKPIQWISEPQGISIDYFDGRPIGRVMGTIRTPGDQVATSGESMLRHFEVGRQLRFQPQVSGTLYLRINDAWNKLADNQGEANITIRRIVDSE